MHEESQMFKSKAAVLCQCQLEVSGLLFCIASGGNIPCISRVNVKMGGINTVPDPQSVSVLTDPTNPTIVMGTFDSFWST